MISVRLTEREGSVAPERRSIHLELRGVNTRPENVLANGEEAGGTLTVRLAEYTGETRVEVTF